jgi:hypothetical protein
MATATDKESLLVTAAKKVGAVAGTLASLGTKKRVSSDGKFEKKHKHRLPRLVKKALKAKAERAALQA